MQFDYTRHDKFIATANLISEFTGLNIIEVLDLRHDVFLLFYRNAYIKNRMQTKEGREQLNLFSIINKKYADYEAIRGLDIYKND